MDLYSNCSAATEDFGVSSKYNPGTTSKAIAVEAVNPNAIATPRGNPNASL
ncbi:hypothetical protein [Laspinema olomoucense]|uniref:hypothetical protein n=1 Tax=Laspinema olomoucense TaxID=3231600 RepID=UPI0021BA77EE|nr:hypothetical protein [Laspinema sp. D3d]MCT7972382.1 hypothetical protein [Laspinema sp. D3d]